MPKRKADEEDAEEEANAGSSIEQLTEDGILEKIVLKDFMIHKHLEITRKNLGPHINFIAGKNGSGKSAICIGIQTALGSRASATERANKLSDLVRNAPGVTSGSTEITLRNRGRDAYRQDLFGNSVTIRRTINKSSGAADYTFYDEHGKKVPSFKKSDYDAMLDRMNIMKDNKLTIMQQATTRDLLATGTEEKLYEYMMEATGLDTLQEICLKYAANLRDMKKTIQRKDETLESRKEKHNVLVQERQANEELVQQRLQLQQFMHMSTWVQAVLMPEEERAEIEQRAAKRQKVFEEAHTKFEQLEEQHKKATEAAQAAATELNSKKDELDRLRDESAQKERAWKIADRDRKLQQDTVSEKEGKVKALNKDIERIETRKQQAIREHQKKQLAKRGNTSLQAKQHEVDQLQTKEAQLRDQVEQAQSERESSASSANAHRDESQSVQHRHGQLTHKKADLEKSLSYSRGRQSNAQKRFGDKIPQLLQKIQQRSGQFKKKPLGPFGEFVDCLDPTCATAIESCLAGVLSNFLVDNKDDESLLRRLVTEVYQGARDTPMISVAPFLDREYATQSVHQRTIMNCIRVADVNVKNELIDRCQIENSVLVGSLQEAHALMNRFKSGQLQPKDKPKAYMPDGTATSLKGERGHVFTAPFRGSKRIFASGSDVQGDIQRTEAELQSIMPELRQLSQEVATKEREQKRLDKLMADKQREFDAKQGQQIKFATVLMKKKQALEREMEKIEAEEDDELDLEPYTEECRDLEMQLTTALEEKNEATKEHDRLRDEIKPLKDEFEHARAARDRVAKDIEEKNRQLRAEMNDNMNDPDLDRARRKREEASRRLEECRRQVEERTKIIESNKEKVRANRPEAFEIEVPPEHCRASAAQTQEYLEGQMTGLRNHLKKRQEENNGRSEQDILQEEAAMGNSVEKLKNAIGAFEACRKSLSEALHDRKRRFKKTRKFIEEELNNDFTHVMRMGRGWDGTIAVEHPGRMEDGTETRGRLSFNVNLQNMHDSQLESVSDTKQLSGGQRTLMMCMFVVSLWKSNGSPFKIMDEFDIYMDDMNRQVVIKMYMDILQDKHPNKQFIFVSPKGFNDVSDKADGSIKKFKMPDPIRSTSKGEQQNLNFAS